MVVITPIYKVLGQANIDNLPVLDIGDRIGLTGYIDFIRNDDMQYPVMKGRDRFNRPFIAIKVAKRLKTTPDELPTFSVGTFFQRYSDNKRDWAYGTCYDFNTIYWDSRVREYDFEKLELRLKRLFDGESVDSIGDPSQYIVYLASTENTYRNYL